MAFKLSRNQALTIRLLTTYGTASLLSRDGEEIKVPLAPLLGASSLIRSMLAESRLHPGIHGPLVLSFTVGSDVLVSEKSEFKDGDIDETEDDSLRKCHVNLENNEERPADPSYCNR